MVFRVLIVQRRNYKIGAYESGEVQKTGLTPFVWGKMFVLKAYQL